MPAIRNFLSEARALVGMLEARLNADNLDGFDWTAIKGQAETLVRVARDAAKSKKEGGN